MADPKWITRARKEVGQAEVNGPGSNPRIVEYHTFTTYNATSDEVPWCSSFVCWVFEKEGIPSTRSAAAMSWLKWGKAIRKPVLGCVVVLKRPGGHHVGFYLGETPDKIDLLGGNQNNRVCVRSFPKDLVLGYRLPIVQTTK